MKINGYRINSTHNFSPLLDLTKNFFFLYNSTASKSLLLHHWYLRHSVQLTLDPAAFKYRHLLDWKQDRSNLVKSRLVSHIHSFVLCLENLFIINVLCLTISVSLIPCEPHWSFPVVNFYYRALTLGFIVTWKWNLFYSCWFVLLRHRPQNWTRLFCTSRNRLSIFLPQPFQRHLPSALESQYLSSLSLFCFEDQRNLQARLNFILKI